ncbi:hypothetical protein NXF25_012154 [Crotalus adamanteus]
MKPLL